MHLVSLVGSMQVTAPVISAAFVTSTIAWPLFHLPTRVNHPRILFQHFRPWMKTASDTERKRAMDDGREEAVLQHVRRSAVRGDPSSVLREIDSFAWTSQWMMNIGDRKGEILRKEVLKAKPMIAVELGAYCGYSSVLIGQHLPPGGKLYSLELSEKFAAIASQMVEFAGLTDKVTFLVGPANQTLKSLQDKSGITKVDLFFFDHWKDCYLADLKVVEQCGYLKDGSVIVADNVIYPGTPDYLAYIRAHPHFQNTFHPAQLEYRTDVEDGVEVSVYRSAH